MKMMRDRFVFFIFFPFIKINKYKSNINLYGKDEKNFRR